MAAERGQAAAAAACAHAIQVEGCLCPLHSFLRFCCLPAAPRAPAQQQRRAGTMQFAADTPPDTVALKSDLLKHR